MVEKKREKKFTDEDADGERREKGEEEKKKKKFTESKILGLANKRKPRIGPDYQVDIPQQQFNIR